MSLQSNQLHVVRHPLVVEALTQLREEATSDKVFRQLMQNLSQFLAYEATASLPLTSADVLTPLNLQAKGGIVETEVVAVPILRAGLGMVDGFMNVVPSASVGFIGLARDKETLLPSEYYCKIPPCKNGAVYILDPMLATGGTACKAISEILSLAPATITIITIVTSPEGVKSVHSMYPQVDIVTAAVDDGLNDLGYIVPGLGDAGDRLWGT